MGDPHALVAEAWDLDAVRTQYDAFIDDFGRVRALTPEACFRQQTLLVHAWRKFPFLDPDLPAELLGDGWPRQRAHELFASRHERWRERAEEYFAQLEAELEPMEERAA
jgi:phenylacetic acid degradation operon negative regulatory protein